MMNETVSLFMDMLFYGWAVIVAISCWAWYAK